MYHTTMFDLNKGDVTQSKIQETNHVVSDLLVFLHWKHRTIILSLLINMKFLIDFIRVNRSINNK